MYPRPDTPLVPPDLAPFFADRRVPGRIARQFGLAQDLRFSDLGRDVWRELPRDAIQALAAEVVSVTRQLFPKITASTALVAIDPSGEGLSLRVRNSLFRAGLIGAPWLKTTSLGALAQEPQLGAKALLEILIAGMPLEQSEATFDGSRSDPQPAKTTSESARISRAVQRAADQLRRRRWSLDVHATDPRLGKRLVLLRSGARTASEAAELLSSDKFDPPDARVKARQIRQFLVEANRLRGITLESEFDQIINSLLGPPSRGTAGVMLRLGLGGEYPVTLAEAGERVGLTRERIRQLEVRLIEGIRDSCPWTPVLDKTLKLLAKTPMRAGDAETLVHEKGLSLGVFSVASIMSAAHVFDRGATVEFDRNFGIIYSGGPLVSPSVVASAARRLTAHWGAATVDTLAAELADRGAENVDIALLRVLLESVPGLNWLDDEKEWFWIKGPTRNRLLNQVEKIIAVAGSIGIAELREGVGRFYRMDGFRPPREVLARICEQSRLCRREGDLMLEGPDVGPWTEVLRSKIERVIAEVMFEYGPLMRRDDLERIAVGERGLNRSSFYVYLGYSPIIARYAPGVYGLRGAQVTAAEVNALIPPRTRTQRLVDHGWTTDGRVWLGYKMSAAAVTAGVLSVPTALREFIKGSYLLFTAQDLPIGTLVVKDWSMWGVSPFFRRWGIEEGDYVVIALDINESRATITSGTEEVLLRYQEGE